MSNKPEGHSVSTEIAGRTLSIQTGRYAEQAQGAVMVRYGDSVVLVTAGGERQSKEDQDFFPLSVDYEEKMYAAGKIPAGSSSARGDPPRTPSFRRPHRPSDSPALPKGYRAEVQSSPRCSRPIRKTTRRCFHHRSFRALMISRSRSTVRSARCAWG